MEEGWFSQWDALVGETSQSISFPLSLPHAGSLAVATLLWYQPLPGKLSVVSASSRWSQMPPTCPHSTEGRRVRVNHPLPPCPLWFPTIPITSATNSLFYILLLEIVKLLCV
jgi:hypothetical protein